MAYPFNELAQLASQLQQQVAANANGLDRRPVLEGGDEPSPKRTRVEGPPRVSMEQQQQQALRAMQNPQGSRLASGQHPAHAQQQSPYPDQDQFSPQAQGQQQQAAMSRAAYSQMMHRRASQQTAQAQAQAQGSPYATNGSMPPPATPNFAGSPAASQHAFERPSSQASQHNGYAMSRSGSGSDINGANGATPGPNSTPRVPGGVLPSASGETTAPAASTGGKGGKAKTAAKKPKASTNKKTPKSSGLPEPPSPAPGNESSAAAATQHHESPYAYPAIQASPQQILAQQQQQHQQPADDHHGHDQQQSFSVAGDDAAAFEFDPASLGMNFNLESIGGMDPFSYGGATLDDGAGGGGGTGEDDFDFSNWMVDGGEP